MLPSLPWGHRRESWLQFSFIPIWAFFLSLEVFRCPLKSKVCFASTRKQYSGVLMSGKEEKESKVWQQKGNVEKKNVSSAIMLLNKTMAFFWFVFLKWGQSHVCPLVHVQIKFLGFLFVTGWVWVPCTSFMIRSDQSAWEAGQCGDIIMTKHYCRGVVPHPDTIIHPCFRDREVFSRQEHSFLKLLYPLLAFS